MEDFKKELDDYFCRFTFGQFVTIILLEIVTLFFVFYLGARYGTDLLGTGNIAKKEDAALPGDNPKSVDDIVGKKPVDYTYPEVLTSPDGQKAIRIKPSGVTADEYERQKAEDPAALAAREAPVEDAPPEAPVEVKTPKKDAKTPEKPAATPPPVQKPPAAQAAEAERTEEPADEKPVEEKTAEEKSSATEPKPKGKFAIQVGSYQSSDEAQQMMGRWKKKGYQAFMATGNVPGKGVWYRVRIGGFGTRDEASKYLDKFKQKEKASAIVVPSNS